MPKLRESTGGVGNRGKGRKPGVPNKATASAREAIGRFVDGNAHKLQEWLDRIAEESPEKAFTLFQSVVEYHVPKLARTELTGKDGKDLTLTVKPDDVDVL